VRIDSASTILHSFVVYIYIYIYSIPSFVDIVRLADAYDLISKPIKLLLYRHDRVTEIIFSSIVRNNIDYNRSIFQRAGNLHCKNEDRQILGMFFGPSEQLLQPFTHALVVIPTIDLRGSA
jgi:hypothetical protein